jgi:hypothetical protein
MLEQDRAAQVRAAIEEELGGFRHLAGLPATEIEQMATRITRAIGALLGETPATESRAA